MTVRCWVAGCGIKKGVCHKLPTKEFEKKKWIRLISNERLKNVKLDDIPTTVGVCRNHFLPNDYNGKRLKTGVCPTQNLPCLSDSESDSDINLEEDCDPNLNKMDIKFTEHDTSLKYTKGPATSTVMLDGEKLFHSLSPNTFDEESVESLTPVTPPPIDDIVATNELSDELIREPSSSKLTVENELSETINKNVECLKLQSPSKITIDDVKNLPKKKLYKKVNRHVKSLNLFMKKLKCPMCQFMSTKHKLLLHYKVFHKLKLKTTTSKFCRMNDFKEWKKEIEYKSASQFVKKYVPNSIHRPWVCEIYVCQCNGLFKLGKTKKKPNHVGLKRFNGYCPAKIIVYTQRSGKITAHYTSTHLGHKTDADICAIRSKEEKRIEFDAIQAEAISSMYTNYEDNSNCSSSNKRKRKLRKRDIFAAEKKNIKNELRNIIQYIDRLKTDENIKLIKEMLAPIISSMGNWLKTLCTPQVSVPLAENETPIPVKHIKVNPVRLYRLPGNPFKRFKGFKETEELILNNNEPSTVSISQLQNEPFEISSDNLCTNIESIVNVPDQQKPTPTVSEIAHQCTVSESTTIVTQGTGGDQNILDPIKTDSSQQLKPQLKLYSRENQRNSKIIVSSDKTISANELSFLRMPPLVPISKCYKKTKTIQLDETLSSDKKSLSLSHSELVIHENNNSSSVATDDVKFVNRESNYTLPTASTAELCGIINLHPELPINPVDNITCIPPLVSFSHVKKNVPLLNYQYVPIIEQNTSNAQMLENKVVLPGRDMPKLY